MLRDTQQRATGRWRGLSGRAAAAGAGRIACRIAVCRLAAVRCARSPGARLCADLLIPPCDLLILVLILLILVLILVLILLILASPLY